MTSRAPRPAGTVPDASTVTVSTGHPTLPRAPQPALVTGLPAGGSRTGAAALGVLLSVAGLAGVVAVPSAAAAGPVAGPVAGPGAKVGAPAAVSATFDAQVLAATNKERTRRGLQPLVLHSCADRYASSWTRSLARRDVFYHQSLSPVLKSCRLRGAGENLAWRTGSLTAAQVVAMWMNSPGHRANILNGRFRYLGVDAWKSAKTGRVYAGQVFGS